MAMGRMAGMIVVLAASSAWAVTIADEQRLKDPDGGKTLAIVVTCNECPGKKPAGKKCLNGTAKGFWEGAPCGECLIKSNYGTRLGYPYDVSLTGTLKDAAGKPLAEQFVKLSLPNGWTVFGRTNSEGLFRLMLGATLERRSKTPLTKELGTFTHKKGTGKDNAFNFYMLPEDFKPCAGKAK
ncbi:MAG: hypothetical protein HY699_11895 [Deltaproteobacteria bacterium]|nr:hypothetical protein [Deltaproteobacteria bacterium]